MKTNIIIFLIFNSFFYCQGKNLSVVTTTEDVASIVKFIGAAKVEVLSLTKGFQDPHFIQAKPSYMLKLNKADILFYIGLELEVGWLPLLVRGARNPKLIQGDLSKNMEVLEVPTHTISRAEGDIHPSGNPHYWLNPNNGVIISENIFNHLVVADPENRDFYKKNKEKFVAELKNNILNWEKKAKKIKGINVLAYHKEFEYLARWLGFHIKGYVENKPGIPPSSKYIHDFIKDIEYQKYRVLICNKNNLGRIVRKIQLISNINVFQLPASVGMEEGIQNYFDLFDVIILKLSSLEVK